MGKALQISARLPVEAPFLVGQRGRNTLVLQSARLNSFKALISRNRSLKHFAPAANSGSVRKDSNYAVRPMGCDRELGFSRN